jgi:hypothetical protein
MMTHVATFLPNSTPILSGHETFALRSHWLKKAYDLLGLYPDLFYRDDAFVLLGVGKNMAQSIRHWGRVCGLFSRSTDGTSHTISPLGHTLLSDEGWDPFLVTPAGRWLLHWQLAAYPGGAFTWFYTFNLLRGGELTVDQLAEKLIDTAIRQGWRVPSHATIRRDITCMLACYTRPDAKILETATEDALACPLIALNLVHALPGDRRFYLASGRHPDLPNALVAYAILLQIQAIGRDTIAFNDLVYAPGSPGRVFRLHEDGLLERLMHLQELTSGRAYYTDQAGIRQVAWPDHDDPTMAEALLHQAFHDEIHL